jgi:hypothetical protein
VAPADLIHFVEDAELRIQRGQLNIDRQRELVSALERDGQDATIAKALLRIFEKALAIMSPIGTGWPNVWQTDFRVTSEPLGRHSPTATATGAQMGRYGRSCEKGPRK